MTDPKIPVTEDELHAYVDNELPAERRGDVEAWLHGRPVPPRSGDEHQHRIMDHNAVATRLGKSENAFRTALFRKKWHLVPPPSGKLGPYDYWTPEDVDQWERTQRGKRGKRPV